MKKIIVFYGNKGVGKDTCFKEFEKQSFFYGGMRPKNVYFSEKVKDIVWDLFGKKIGDKERVWGVSDKKEELIEGWNMPEDIKEQLSIDDEFWSGRRLLQWFATDVCRKIYSNIWVDRTIDDLLEQKDSPHADVFIITDCRFKNEYLKLKQLHNNKDFEVIFIKINRDLGENAFSGHESELQMNDFVFDHEIDNNGTLDDLEDILKSLIDVIYGIHATEE